MTKLLVHSCNTLIGCSISFGTYNEDQMVVHENIHHSSAEMMGYNHHASLAAQFSRKLHQVDVKNAFLHSELHEEL